MKNKRKIKNKRNKHVLTIGKYVIRLGMLNKSLAPVLPPLKYKVIDVVEDQSIVVKKRFDLIKKSLSPVEQQERSDGKS